MSIGNIIRTVLELAAIIFVMWGLFNEDKFVAFEERLFARIRRNRFKIIKGGNKTPFPSSSLQRKSV